MIQIHNTSLSRASGIFHTTVDQKPALPSGQWPGTRIKFVVGKQVGIGPWEVDVFVDLAANQRITLDPATAQPWAYRLELPPEAIMDPLGYFGAPTLVGTPFVFLRLEEHGGHYQAYFRIRGNPLCYDLMLRVVPGDDEFEGELKITNSDERDPNLTYTLPIDIEDFLDQGDHLADAQRRVWPIFYNRTTRRLGMSAKHVHGKGLEKIGVLGLIADKGLLNVQRWIDKHDRAAFAALSNWNDLQLGVTARSENTGDQEDQGFGQGFEAFYGDSLVPVTTRYYAALTQAKRPMHYLDRAGEPLDPEAVGVVYWNCRPWRLSPNRLGKGNQELSETQAHGWMGPDGEHFLLYNVIASLELTGSPALQDDLVHHAYLYLGSETLDPNLSTSKIFVARALGWMSLAVCGMWRLLNDRALAERVKARWIAKVRMYRAQWGDGLWDVRRNETGSMFGLTDPFFWMAYQQAVGAFGVFVCAELFGETQTMAWAKHAAEDVVRFGYSGSTEWDILGLEDKDLKPQVWVEGPHAHRSGFYSRAWMPLAVWVAEEQLLYASIKSRPIDPTAWDRTDDWCPPMRAGT